MIDRVSFENFKSLENVSLDLGRLTVLVGQNGSGKSSVLQGMHLLSQTGLPRRREGQTAWNHLRSVFSGPRDARRLVSRGRQAMVKLGMRDQTGDKLSLMIAVPAASEDDPAADEDDPAASADDAVEGDDEPNGSAPEFHVSVNGPEGTIGAQVSERGIPARALEFLRHARVRRFTSVVYLHLDASEMVRTSISQGEAPRMRFDGSGLASTLAWMKGAAEDELADITRDLTHVVPGVKRIRTLRARVRKSRMERLNIDGQAMWRPVKEIALGDRFEIEFDEGPPVPADLLSEGTVLALGLLTKLREPARPRLVLLDDIDRGLHIEAQARLVRVLRELLKLDPELQIVCTTHSTHLLNLFEPDEVRVLALDEHRRTRAQPLTAHPEFDKWRFGTQTGELWAALGNAWVAAPLEGAP